MFTHFIVHSLKEAVKKVVGYVKDLALTLIFLVMDKVKREGRVVPSLPERLKSLRFILSVNNQGLEIIKAKT